MSEDSQPVSFRLPQDKYEYIEELAEENSETKSDILLEYVEKGMLREQSVWLELVGPLREFGEYSVLLAILSSVGAYVAGYGSSEVFSLFIAFVLIALTFMGVAEVIRNRYEEEGVFDVPD